MFTARPPSGGWTALWLRVAREGPPGSGGHLGGPAEHVLDRWPCAPSRHTPPPNPETTPRVSSGPSTAPSASPPPAQPKNPSEDRKEVVLSVRSAGEPPIKDTACQTNGSQTTGIRTVQTISTDGRTEAPQGGAVTRSPDTGLMPRRAWRHTCVPDTPQPPTLPQQQAGGLSHREGAGLV